MVDWMSQTSILSKSLNVPIFLKDGRLVFNSLSTIQIWNFTRASLDISIPNFNYIFEELSNGFLATGAFSFTTIKIFNIVYKTLIATLQSVNTVSALKQLKTCNYLASGDSQGEIYLWNTYDFSLINTLHGHSSIISGIDELKIGIMVSISYDGSIKIWAIPAGKCLNTFTPLIPVYVLFNLKVISKNQILLSTSFKILVIQVNDKYQMKFNRTINTPYNSVSINDLKLTKTGLIMAIFADGTLGYYNLTTSQLIRREATNKTLFHLAIPSKIFVFAVVKKS